MNTLEISQESQTDHQAVFELHQLAFEQADESKLVDKLRQSENFIPELSLVAKSGDQLIGHILFTRIHIMGESSFESLALAPMGVLPSYQRTGIGSELVKKGLERAKELGEGSVIVLGHPEYYPRFGFEPASRYAVQCPFEVPDEAFMALELIEGSLKDVTGVVKYADAFMEM